MKEKLNCDCPVVNCLNGHFPLQEDENGDVLDWGGCPKCVKNGTHQCENKTN